MSVNALPGTTFATNQSSTAGSVDKRKLSASETSPGDDGRSEVAREAHRTP